MPRINKIYQDIEDDIILSYDEIISQLHKLPNKNSSGPDGIPNILLKNLSEEFCRPLSILFQPSSNKKEIPN